MLLLGNCNDHLKQIKDNSIDLILTDPPYGIEFMGKDWDKAVVPMETWKECYRILKQGKLAFIMCSPRQDVLSRMIINLQDAGFRTNYTSLYHTFASGFPKAKNNRDGSYVGWQPKPAVEIILVVSKGKTLTWLDDCRIPYQSQADYDYTDRAPKIQQHTEGYRFKTNGEINEKGRFPANLICQDDILNDSCTGEYSRYFSLDSWAKTFPFLIVPKASKQEKNKGCEDLPIRERQGTRPNSPDITGKFPEHDNERQAQNFHPTVKPIKLMSYLITMGSREGDLVLDPFCGSGTTLLAAHQLHRKYLGIELNPEYAQIIKKRMLEVQAQLKLTIY